MKDFLKIFQSRPIPGLYLKRFRAKALQREALICKNAILHRDCKTRMGKVFTQTNAISKRIKIELLDWRQMKELLKGFETVYDFIKF